MLTETIKTDAQIKADVVAELQWDPRVDETSIGVQVHHGIVSLTGNLKNYAEKLAAQQAAHRVQGVHDVANEIEVHTHGLWKKSDAQIAAAVRSALEWDALVPDKDIHSTVTDGWVTLTGVVNRWSHREDAARAVHNLTGVRGVTNNLIIAGATPSPERIRRDIEQALLRQVEREADRITIDVNDGIITLAGRVRSWAEKRAVRGVAGCAPGIRAIEDQIVIDPNA